MWHYQYIKYLLILKHDFQILPICGRSLKKTRQKWMKWEQLGNSSLTEYTVYRLVASVMRRRAQYTVKSVMRGHLFGCDERTLMSFYYRFYCTASDQRTLIIECPLITGFTFTVQPVMRGHWLLSVLLLQVLLYSLWWEDIESISSWQVSSHWGPLHQQMKWSP